MRRFWRSALGAATALAALAPAAQADFGVQPGTFTVTTSTQQAGAHPDLTTAFTLNMAPDQNGTVQVEGNLKDAIVDLPAGLSGATTATPRCPARDLQNLPGEGCPASTQVGVATVYNNVFGNPFPATVPVFNLEPSHGRTAELGFVILVANQRMTVKVRPDGGLQTEVLGISEDIQMIGTSLTLWGVPASPAHDPQRGTSFQCFGDPADPNNCFGGNNAANVPAHAFLTNPTSCGGPLQASLRISSWQQPEITVEETADLPPITGCDKLQFEPTLALEPDTTKADAPMGLTVEVRVPQNDDPAGLASANLRDAVVTLPDGVTLNPATADGLVACSDEALGLGSTGAPTCPDASKIGTAVLSTPALPEPLGGAVYVRPQTAGAPYRIALVLSGSGVMLKIPGTVRADASTGRLTTTFADAPQQPFSSLRLTFKGGARAPLASPASCGAAQATSVMTAWSGLTATPSAAFAVDADGKGGGCAAAAPFAPGFSAGVTNPIAGAKSPFTFRLTRDDRQRTLGAVRDVHLPAGLLADVSSMPLCSAAAAASATCPASTRVGDVRVGSGAGAAPLYLPGSVFLTGPYKGAPFGLSIVVRALAGPYDLGTVNVRAAVKVNPDASLTVEADPLPTILEGVPLRLRDIMLDLDRPGFMFNPTSCAPTAITASVVSADGLAAAVSDRFQVGECAALGYRPGIALKLGGRETSGVTSLSALVVPRLGDANSRKISVKLPKRIGINVNSGRKLCTTAQAAAHACPQDTIVGAASVDSILHEPLTGPVYFVEGTRGAGGTPLPKLFVPLTGEGVTIDLTADTTLEDNRIVTTFDHIPDVPFRRFGLKIYGGTGGILSAERTVCRSTLTSPVKMDGQNGKLADRTLVVPAGCPLRVLSKLLSAKRLTLKVGGLGAGTLRVSGVGLRGTRKTIASATVVTIAASRARRSTPARVQVTFDPAGPAKARTIRVAMPMRTT